MTPYAPARPRVQAAPKSRFFLNKLLGLGVLALFIAGCGGGGGGSSGGGGGGNTTPPATYTIAGAIGGLSAPGLVLQNNGGDNLTIAAHATSFQFPTQVATGGSYAVTVSTQPQGLTCSVSRGSGGPVNAPVADIGITCSPITHTVGGAITGLSTAGLVLRNNGADDLVVPANAASFQFTTPVASGGGYNVTVLSQPTGLTCTVNGGAGASINADINNIQVVCSTSALTIGGSVAGLTGSGLVLLNNGGDNLAMAANATRFEFPTPVAYGSNYNVSVFAQPAGQLCSVSSGSGAATTHVGDVSVTCANIVTYTVTTSSGPNGSVSPNGAIVVNSGATLNFTATPNVSYAVNQWLVDGSVAQTGGSVYQLTNITANHTVSVSFAQATLARSVSSLALVVDNTATNAALTGNARQVTFTNIGSMDATNVALNPSGLPLGTIASNTCSGTLAAGGSCTITVTPGANATSDCTTGIAPTAGTLTVSADNADAAEVEVVVLGYGCIYQGGYLFAVDDTTSNTGSIAGKVVATTDQSTGIAWSSDGSGGPDFTPILGIDETSTASTPSPTAPPYPVGTPVYLACNGAVDGACNTANIVAYYNFNRAAGGPAPTPLTDYAAGACTSTISGHSDWYLPTICEWGYGSSAGCGSQASPLVQNIWSNLIDPAIVTLNPLASDYWSSTESSTLPTVQAWSQTISGTSQSSTKGAMGFATRCARALTP